MTAPRLFAVPDIDAPAPESPDRRRTRRNRDAIANGIHPVTRRPLADNGETCGTCANHVTRRQSRTWHKCRLNESASAATDIRVSWPACTAWEAS